MVAAARCSMLLALFVLVCPSGPLAQEPYPVRQLTDDPAQDGFPCWSPDGQSIVFSRYGAEEAPEKTGLWMMSSDGSGLRRLTTVIGEHPDWSPDGQYIAFDGDYGNSIQLVAASGGQPIRIVPESIPVSLGGQPKWSPDGSLIAFKEESNLWLLEVSTGKLDRVLSTPGKKPIPTCWSNDGSEIYLFLFETDSPTAAVAAVSRTGEGLRQVAREEGIKYRYSALSPDGTLLAVVRCEGRDCNILVTSPGGRGRVQVTAHPGYDDGPCWSPDGTKLAFVSTRSGHFDIWVVEVDPERLRHELSSLDDRE